MRGRVGDGDEGGDERVVLPTPYALEEISLYIELEHLNGTWTGGKPSIIRVPRPGGSGWIYLSGRRTLYTLFFERAYVLGENDALRLIERYPRVLEGAKVVVRGRGPRR